MELSLLRDVIWELQLPDRSAAGRHGSGNSRRPNALDPGFHGVPAGSAHPGS